MKSKKESKKEVAMYDKAEGVFDFLRETLNLPTTISQKKKKFKIDIVVENFKIGELSLKKLPSGELQVLKVKGIFKVSKIATLIKSQLKKIRKEIQLEKKAAKKALREETKTKVSETKVVKKKAKKEKKVRTEKKSKRNK